MREVETGPEEPEFSGAELLRRLRPGDPALCLSPDDLGQAVAAVELAQLEASASAESARSRILAFCQDNPDALYRHCLGGHLTASAVVVDPLLKRSLLLHHTKLDRWLQPGGHVDGDGNLAAAALREAQEETGLQDLEVVTPAVDLDVHSIPARGDEPEHVHLDVRFLVLAHQPDLVLINHESRAWRWVEASDPLVTAEPELHRLVRRGLAAAAAVSR